MPPPRSRDGQRPSGSGPAAEADSAPPAIDDRELDALFAALEGVDVAVLAISGGADSMAMLCLAARWARASKRESPRLHVATVDHGLRPESASEAQFVAQAARRLGLDHTILRWDGAKPGSGLPAVARAARYRLLAAEARRIGASAILTAHTESDQAETLLMRLARGSGVDGLSAMAPASTVHGIRLLRPLLGLPRERLTATLVAAGEAWVEDPTNADEAYERVRLRQAAPALSGLGLSSRALALSARRLKRARDALEQATDSLARTAAVVHASGYVRLDWRVLRAAPEELALRLIQRSLAAVGAAAEPAGLSQVEAALAAMLAAGAKPMTLGGCRLAAKPDQLLVFREPGRKGLPVSPLAPGETVLWDGRFEVSLGAAGPEACEVRAPTPSELKRMAINGEWRRGTPPLEAARTAPALFHGAALVAAPLHGATGHPAFSAGLLRGRLDESGR